MGLALEEALAAPVHADVPVGAVVLVNGEVVAARHNERERSGDPTAHAEILALRDAAAVLGGWRLSTATLVVTLEPCPMCAGALVAARVGRAGFRGFRPQRRSLRDSVQPVLRSTAQPRATRNRRRARGGVCDPSDLVLCGEARGIGPADSRRVGAHPLGSPRRDARVAESDGLENRCASWVPWVRIPLPPPPGRSGPSHL